MFKILKAIDICYKVFDGTHDSPKYVESGYPLVTSKYISNNKIDIINPSKISKNDFDKINLRSKVEIDDILISMIGTVGLVARIKDEPTFAIKNIGVLRPKNKLDSKYFFYFLQSNYAQELIMTQLNGSTQQYLSLDKLRNLNILYPKNEKYKQHIVNTIGSIDNLIENLNKIKDKLHEFVSVRLKNEPSSIKLLGDYINIYDNIRKPLSSMERTGEKIYPYYGATGILDYVSNYIFDDEYVLLAEDGSVMNNEEKPIIQYINGKTWVGNHAHVLKATNGLSLYSLYFILKDTNVKNAVTGAVQMKINQANLKKISIKLPFDIEGINKFTESVMNEMIIINNKLIDLNNLKQQYLKKFFG